MEPSIEKKLGVVSFETREDKKKYRSKKRKERKIKQEKGEKVKRVYKQDYHSSSEDESDSQDESEDSYSDSSSSESEEEEQPKKKQQKKPTQGEKQNQQKNDPDRFSNIMESILRKEPAIVKSGGAPILSKYKKKKTEDEADQEETKKKQKKKRQEKDMVESVSHKKIDVLITSEEREKMRVAKRGVIKLFNAVAKHQLENPVVDADLDDEIDPQKDEMTKNQFLSKLKDKKSTDSKTTNNKKQNVKKENNNGSSWDAFDEDLMSNPKSSQWEEYDNNE
ncbi:hypothetical protein DFA_05977 [Cavenderia fasciculata]|uniref:RRP15-like protein n=1 Tax=Cavenderia fasciculata TaxID=261658 RepID=F4PJR7_CACFS|nr:uncharacterized protein DFA_05977 [Cavenderia fasciculata]EGG23841.1 hypothetical protein DFA_05977 [Cavenderia fasciculata]|eukprot:XP_004361692.1 hypothetical protein DFA_05977 [Cavenderia fasciculata]